jgi:hypothetical protein
LILGKVFSLHRPDLGLKSQHSEWESNISPQDNQFLKYLWGQKIKSNVRNVSTFDIKEYTEKHKGKVALVYKNRESNRNTSKPPYSPHLASGLMWMVSFMLCPVYPQGRNPQ